VNFELSDEQVFLRDAARDALLRVNTIEAAHGALDGEPLPELWDTARQAGWTGLLISEQHGGAGLGGLDAMLVAAECGRVLASVPLLGHVPATALLDRAGFDGLEEFAGGERRACLVPARPPGGREEAWTVEAERGMARAPAPEISGDGSVSGFVPWVPDAPGADLLVVMGVDADGAPAATAVEGVEVEPLTRYDPTRPLGHVRLDGTPGTRLDVDEDALAAAWYLTQCLIAAESLGAVESALETSVAYAKERFTFGRAIGSYQAIKHGLVEVLRRLENARSLMYYAGWARQDAPAEFPVAASAVRVAAGGALDYASRELISVHGGIGATWEHDAPLYFRRAQLSRRLLGGTGDAADRVADELLAAAAPA
jgi:alkylation response protein AidB-like acyl-CoA dehydrogenase